MTKEEIIEAISNDKIMPFIQQEQLAEIVDFVIKNYKESKDEKIRKELIDYFRDPSETKVIPAYKFKEWCAWLEKQKEQKPAEWSEEDTLHLINAILASEKEWGEDSATVAFLKSLSPQLKQEWSKEDSRILYNVIAYIGFAAGQRGVRNDEFKEANSWLKSLPERFNLQSNQEWSEEDKGILLECISALQNSSHWLLADKLSSLRPQPHWKPSKEQPKVDLEKEAAKFVQSKEFIKSEESPVLLIARHFYELGLKARKEE